VSLRDLAFYNTDMSLANLNELFWKQEKTAREMKKLKHEMGCGNPNKAYIGKRIMIVGKRTLKGYKGVILDILMDGMVSLELDNQAKTYQQTFPLDSLRLLMYVDS